MDIRFMELAIEEALKGHLYDEVPVGAVIVKDNDVIASAHNEKEQFKKATKHAEIIAIEKASEVIGDWRLTGCDLYVTLEPCPMCAGAIINSRLDKVYFGAYDNKAGCCGSLYNLLSDKRFNHQPEVIGGIMQDQCSRMISSFFLSKRPKH